jgi:hypothetical protein
MDEVPHLMRSPEWGSAEASSSGHVSGNMSARENRRERSQEEKSSKLAKQETKTKEDSAAFELRSARAGN